MKLWISFEHEQIQKFHNFFKFISDNKSEGVKEIILRFYQTRIQLIFAYIDTRKEPTELEEGKYINYEPWKRPYKVFNYILSEGNFKNFKSFNMKGLQMRDQEQEGEEIEEEEEDDDEEEEQSDEEVEEEESSDENEQLIEDCEDQYELEQEMMLENESLNDEILRQYEKAIEQEIEANKNLSPPKKIKNMQHNQLNINYYVPAGVQNKSMQKSIMKNRQDQSYTYQSPIYASLENSENITNHSLSTTSSQVSSSYNYSSIDNSSNNLINKMASMTIESTSSSQVTTTTTTTSHAKPKVRFNLDINYEKEREWNRVNKIIGDASKSQIEWTQEVEV